MKRSWRLSICSVTSICGLPCTWQRKPCSAYSGAKLMPERPALSDSVTCSASLPIEETMPRPVITTRRMAGPPSVPEQADLHVGSRIDQLAVRAHLAVGDAELELAVDHPGKIDGILDQLH